MKKEGDDDQNRSSCKKAKLTNRIERLKARKSCLKNYEEQNK